MFNKYELQKFEKKKKILSFSVFTNFRQLGIPMGSFSDKFLVKFQNQDQEQAKRSKSPKIKCENSL